MGVIFESNWDTALGNSDIALRDTGALLGPWTVFEVGGTVASNPNEMVVVNLAPAGLRNSLRLQQQGSSGNGWARVARLGFTPPSTDYYLRYYIRNDDVGGASQDHVVQPGLVGNIYNDLTYLNKGEFAGGWRPRMVLGANQGANRSAPNWDWTGALLAYGRWYRFEYWVHFTALARIQVRVCVYDDAGALVGDDATFSPDPGWCQWTTATLATYYAGTNPGGGVTDFGITPANLVNIEFGNNGSASASNTGLYWYFAGVQIRDDTWSGPIDATAPASVPAPIPPPVTPPPADTTPPTITVSAAGPVTVRSVVTLTDTFVASVADNIGVVGVQWRIDGVNVGMEQTAPPYKITRTLSRGTHSIVAVARDAAGNLATSAAVVVVVP